MKPAALIAAVLLLAACTKEQPAPPVATTAPAAPAPAAPAPKPAAPPAVAAVPAADVLKQGEDIFNNTCATCHMADGYGVPNLQPAIVGSAWISNPDPQLLLTLILRGSAVLGEAAKAYENDMAPQDHLSDAEVAAVATYVRGRFGAPPVTKPVTPAEVAIARSRPGLP